MLSLKLSHSVFYLECNRQMEKSKFFATPETLQTAMLRYLLKICLNLEIKIYNVCTNEWNHDVTQLKAKGRRLWADFSSQVPLWALKLRPWDWGPQVSGSAPQAYPRRSLSCYMQLGHSGREVDELGKSIDTWVTWQHTKVSDSLAVKRSTAIIELSPHSHSVILPLS